MAAEPRFEPKDPQYAERVRASFARQDAMKTIGATLASVEPGVVVIEMPWAQALTQQHGFLHAGMVATGLDTACGYAGFSLMPADAAVLTVEYKINLLAPGAGPALSHGRRGGQARPHAHDRGRQGLRHRRRPRETHRHHERHADGPVRP